MTTDLLKRYLSEPAGLDDAGQELEDARREIRLGQPLFEVVAGLVTAHDVALLERLYSGSSRLHSVIGDDPGFRRDEGFADRAGAPFRDTDTVAVHAVRALAGLGLALTGDVSAEGPLRSALAWYTDARGSPATHKWDPRDIDRGQPRLLHLAELLADAASDESTAGAALTTAVTLHALASWAARWEKGQGPDHPRTLLTRLNLARERQASVTVLLVRSGEGVPARLKVSVVKGLPPGFAPDPEQMTLFSADPDFQQSLNRAWSQAGTRHAGGTVLWSIKEREGPIPRIDGESAGAALTVALDEIGRLSRPLAELRVIRRLQGSNAIVGGIDDLGYLQRVEGYDGKLAALSEDSRVIVPAVDTEKARKAANREIIPASDWKEAASKARRRNGKVVLRQGLTVALVLAVAIGMFAWRQGSNANAQQRVSLSYKVAALASSLSSAHPGLARQLLVAADHVSAAGQVQGALLSSQSIPREYDFPGAVNATAYGPGRPFLAVGTDQGITLMSAATGSIICVIPSTTGPVSALAFSTRGDMLAAGYSRGAVHVWDIRNPAHPALTATEQFPGTSISVLSFTPGGILAVTLQNSATQLFTLTDPAHPVVLSAVPGDDTADIGAMAISPDGHLMATGGQHWTVRLWDITIPAHPVPLATMTGPGTSVDALAFSPTGHLLAASAQQTSTVGMWDVTDPRHPAQRPGLTASGTDGPAIAFSPAGDTLAVAVGNTVQVWNVTDPIRPSDAATLTGHDDSVNAVAFSPDGQTLATGSYDKTLRLWDITDAGNSAPMTEIRAANAYAAAVFSLNGHYMVAGNPPVLWDVTEPARPVQIAVFPQGSATTEAQQIAFSPGGQTVATLDNQVVTVWSMTDPRHPEIAVRLRAQPGALTFTDSHTLADATGTTVRRWDITVPARPLTLSSLSVPSALSQPPSMAGSDALVGLAAPADTQAIASLVEHHQAADILTLSPDRKTLAAIGPRGQVTLWDVSKSPADQLATLNVPGPTEYPQASFSPDGKALAFASPQGMSLWDVTNPASPVLITTLTSNHEFVSAAFSPDGDFLATTSLDGTVDLWDLSIPRILNRLCSGVGTPITQAQWNRYLPGIRYDNPCPARAPGTTGGTAVVTVAPPAPP